MGLGVAEVFGAFAGKCQKSLVRILTPTHPTSCTCYT